MQTVIECTIKSERASCSLNPEKDDPCLLRAILFYVRLHLVHRSQLLPSARRYERTVRNKKMLLSRRFSFQGFCVLLLNVMLRQPDNINAAKYLASPEDLSEVS